MAKRYRRARRYFAKARSYTKNKKIPILPIAGIIATPAFKEAVAQAQSGQWASVPVALGYFAGIRSDGKWDFNVMKDNLTPVIAGMLGHIVMSKLGVNRAIAKVPLVNL